MSTIKTVMMGLLLAVLIAPVYAHDHGRVFLNVSPGMNYAQPMYGSYCLRWIPQSSDDDGNWIPGHYENVCYYQGNPYAYYYGYGYGYGHGFHEHNHDGGHHHRH